MTILFLTKVANKSVFYLSFCQKLHGTWKMKNSILAPPSVYRGRAELPFYSYNKKNHYILFLLINRIIYFTDSTIPDKDTNAHPSNKVHMTTLHNTGLSNKNLKSRR